LTKVYTQLELPIDDFALEASKRYLGPVPDGIIPAINYMSLYRGPHHNENAWKTMLTLGKIRELESMCATALKLYKYK
jgi:hypothetical protein